VLQGGGSVKAVEAKAHAVSQYQTFNAKRKAVRHAAADAAIAALKAQEKALPRSAKKPRKTNSRKTN